MKAFFFKTLLLISLSCFAYVGQSQVSLNYFSDSEVRLGTNVYQHLKSGSDIIIGGQSLKNSVSLQPFIAKIDTAGNVLWNTVDNDPDSYPSQAINWSVVEMKQMGNYIYALVKSNTTNSNGGHKELWRVDANNGAILYKKLLSSSHYYKICGLEDFDATRFILYYYPNVGQPKIGVVRKSDGQGVGQLSLPYTAGNVAFHLATDESQNIYYSLKDSIYKHSSNNLNTVAWRTALPASYNMLDYVAIHADTSGGLYLFGTHDAFLSNNGKGRVVSLDTANGNMLWQTDANTASTVQEVTFEDKLGHLYVSWRHATVGSTDYKCMLEKYSKQTGNQVWQNNFDFSLLPAPALPKGSSEAGMDILVDDAGDAYITGYYAANDYGPGTWGIAKFNGVNGNNLFQTTVIKDSSDHDDASHGIGCVLINNQLYSLGNRQEFPNAHYHSGANAQLVKLDKQSGAILQHQRLLDDYNFQSRTVGIERVGKTKTAVLKQVGLNGVLELYDFNENLLWSHKIRSYHLFNADILEVFDDGSMVVAGHSAISLNTPPYYANWADTNHLLHYSNSGQLLNHWKVEAPNRERVLQVVSNGSEVFAVIKTSNVQFGVHSIGVSKFDAGGFVAKKNLGQVNTVDPTIQRVVQLGNSLGCFVLIGKASYLELDMASMTLSSGATINNCSSTYHIDKLKHPQQVLLCTRNGSYDQLMAYDVSVHDTLWTQAYENDSRIWKFVYDTDTNFAYTMGYKGNQFNTLVIRKIRLSDGHQLWSNEYAAPTFALLDALPYDIAWDANRHQVVVSGVTQDTTGFSIRHDVLVHTVDSSGTTVQTFTQRPFGTLQNVANTVEVLPNGSVWAGGNLYRDRFNKEGFIFGLDTANLYCGVARSITTCGAYTSPYSARTYTESGVYLDTLVTTSGCDSLLELTLTLDSLNTTVTQNGITLSSVAANASYQWLDCGDGFKPVPAAVNSSFTPTVDGVYAVELREGSCIDTSACFTVQGVGLREHYLSRLAVYPNPSAGTFTIQLPDRYSTVEVKLSDIQGKTVYNTQQKPEGTACTIRTALAKGIYLGGVYHGDVLVGRFKVVLE